jgi:superfamily I DNA and/or RNA helicase
VQLLRQMCRERLGADAETIDVDTVERYQGSERDAIFVSLVKTERAGDFLADTRRLNVTLTRPKQKIVLFGSRSCLRQNPLYRDLIDQDETTVVSWRAEPAPPSDGDSDEDGTSPAPESHDA